jgi:hypothetical protein
MLTYLILLTGIFFGVVSLSVNQQILWIFLNQLYNLRHCKNVFSGQDSVF